MRLAAIGDNCVDFYEKQGWAYPGGNAVNVAVYGRQLGMDAAYLGWIGTDNFGDMMQEKLKEQDVEIVRMQRNREKLLSHTLNFWMETENLEKIF